DYNPGDAVINISYPHQEVEKYTFKYEHNNMDFFLADRMSFVVYTRGNERELYNDIFVPFGIPGMPSAGINIITENYSDITSSGLRMEMNKNVKSHLFTYGVDYFVDSTRNTDKLTSQMLGFAPFPLYPSVSTVPNVPNASYKSLGVFIQDDISFNGRASLILGVRYQNANATTKETPGLEGISLYDSTDDTFVGAANLSYGITENLKLVVSVGRGFRSPNLIERFYDGATPEGSGYQSRNTDLKAETSLNFDLGFKFRSRIHFLEFTYFNNTIYDGIRISPTGNTVMELPEYKNVNIDKLRMKGFEMAGGVYMDFGLSVSFNFTKLSYDDLGIAETSYVDTFTSKFNLNVRYDHPGNFFWAGYDLRITGDQKDVQIGENPIGEFLPGFTVHNASIGINLFRNSDHPLRVALMMGNFTNALYSEISNATFFRPAPKRYVVLTWSMDF
ncbi:MAG: TonB-dependent receptor, partial [Candidatus Aminicenantes bacterium]|nr:TonB-dependent receptor [Candidatus Aminicenantes bacterium]